MDQDAADSKRLMDFLARELRDRSANNLDEEINLDRRGLGKILAGERPNIELRTLHRLARAAGLRVTLLPSHEDGLRTADELEAMLDGWERTIKHRGALSDAEKLMRRRERARQQYKQRLDDYAERLRTHEQELNQRKRQVFEGRLNPLGDVPIPPADIGDPNG